MKTYRPKRNPYRRAEEVLRISAALIPPIVVAAVVYTWWMLLRHAIDTKAFDMVTTVTETRSPNDSDLIAAVVFYGLVVIGFSVFILWRWGVYIHELWDFKRREWDERRIND